MTVFVGPSIWRALDVRTATAVYVAMRDNPTTEPVIWAPLWNDALIGRSRSLMCTEFLKTDADVMVIIDDDIVFEPDDFWKIVEGARETRGIYGGAYVTRALKPHLTSRAFPNTQVTFKASPVRNPIEFQYLATGFYALHRDVLEAMIDHDFDDADGGHKMGQCVLGADRPFWPFFMPFMCMESDGRRHYLSEDWAFCNRARQLGIKVWVDQSIILQHMGLYPYTVADLNTPGSAFASTGIDRATIPGEPPVYSDPLIGDLIADIAEWSGETVGDARRMVAEGQEWSHKLFEDKPADETEAEWYQREDVGMAYVADLANWHLRGRGAPAAYAPNLAGKRVYDHGCGIGTFALQAARAGANVSAYEPNPTMRDFLGWRASKHDIDIAILPYPSSEQQNDAVVCWHVFEHLENPEQVLDELLSMIAPGGVLITDDGFDDQHTPQHHQHADWPGVLASRGLSAVAECIYIREPAAVTA